MQTKDVVTCFLESDNQILILRRSSQVRTYQDKWAAVSGSVENTPDEQAWREIREETGLEDKDISLVAKGEPLAVIDENLQVTWIVHPYLFHLVNPQEIRIDWEHQEIKWIHPSDIDDYSTVPKLKEALQAVTRDLSQ